MWRPKKRRGLGRVCPGMLRGQSGAVVVGGVGSRVFRALMILVLMFRSLLGRKEKRRAQKELDWTVIVELAELPFYCNYSCFAFLLNFKTENKEPIVNTNTHTALGFLYASYGFKLSLFFFFKNNKHNIYEKTQYATKSRWQQWIWGRRKRRVIMNIIKSINQEILKKNSELLCL